MMVMELVFSTIILAIIIGLCIFFDDKDKKEDSDNETTNS